jgi:hypothetical protein
MRKLAWLLLATCLLASTPVLAEDYTGSDFLLRDPFLSLAGGYTSSASFIVYSQTGARIESGYSAGGDFIDRAGTESYPHFTSPVITATAGDAEVDLSWTASQAYFGGVISSYSVGVSGTSGGPYTYTNVGVSTSTTVNGLTNNAVYYFIIKVNDANANQNTYSAEVSATPVAAPVAGGGGGGGGGDGSPGDAGENQVNFSGRAFPDGEIYLLKDGEIVAESVANAGADFALSLENLSSGSYNFILYGEDDQGRRSASLSFRVRLESDAVTNISGVYLSPTSELDKSQVLASETVSVSGRTVPNSTVTILVDAGNEIIAQAVADAGGYYTYAIDPRSLVLGRHLVRVKSSLGSAESDFGRPVSFTLVDPTTPVPPDGEYYQPADLNQDTRVNLVDFAIAGYWYKRELTPAFLLIERRHLNGDGRLDLTDFAIMAYYWNG